MITIVSTSALDQIRVGTHINVVVCVLVPAEYIAAVYAEMRQLEAAAGADTSSTYTTPRTLLSILRLAQAVAKLR